MVLVTLIVMIPKKESCFITTLFESTGLTLSTINYFVDKENKWKLFDQFNYSAFERVDFTIRYLKIISNKSSFASRLHRFCHSNLQ